MARPCRIYPLGANTELATQENGNLYIGSVTETGSGASANIGKITTITSTPVSYTHLTLPTILLV